MKLSYDNFALFFERCHKKLCARRSFKKNKNKTNVTNELTQYLCCLLLRVSSLKPHADSPVSVLMQCIDHDFE
ncbi:hypothetical protein DFR28_102465 [Arenicella xantha]|uniref:Uncharacterized protein n=1 Tax=Arenicella xantha TaxID=644221 RepID=A0A395JJT8_9GAMM|nr:hypothetical protein DFR28_102465 [Arenicella xantha]